MKLNDISTKAPKKFVKEKTIIKKIVESMRALHMQYPPLED